MEQRLHTRRCRGSLAATVRDAAAEKHVLLCQAKDEAVRADCGFRGLWNV